MTLAVSTPTAIDSVCSQDIVGMSNLVTFQSTRRRTAGICGAWSMAMSAIRRCGNF